MQAKDKSEIYHFFKERISPKTMIVGSTAMELFGLIPKGSSDPQDLDLVIFLNQDESNQFSNEIEKKLKLLWGHVETMEDKKDVYGGQDPLVKRFFYKYVDYDNKIINVHVFLTTKMFDEQVFVTFLNGTPVRVCSPLNVILAKKSFNRKKDTDSLLKIAKFIMP